VSEAVRKISKCSDYEREAFSSKFNGEEFYIVETEVVKIYLVGADDARSLEVGKPMKRLNSGYKIQ